MKYIHKLKFDSPEQWETIKAQLYDKNGTALTPMHQPVVIGIITPNPVWNDETEEYDIQEPLEGWHVDIKAKQKIDILNDYIVTCSNPRHNWSGGGVVVEAPKPVPNDSWLKADIQSWLTDEGIEWDKSMLKAELLALIP